MNMPTPPQAEKPEFSEPIVPFNIGRDIEPYLLWCTAGFGALAVVMLILRGRLNRKDPLA